MSKTISQTLSENEHTKLSSLHPTTSKQRGIFAAEKVITVEVYGTDYLESVNMFNSVIYSLHLHLPADDIRSYAVGWREEYVLCACTIFHSLCVHINPRDGREYAVPLKQLQKLVAAGCLSCTLTDNGTETTVLTKRWHKIKSDGSGSSPMKSSVTIPPLVPVVDRNFTPGSSVTHSNAASTTPVAASDEEHAFSSKTHILFKGFKTSTTSSTTHSSATTTDIGTTLLTSGADVGAGAPAEDLLAIEDMVITPQTDEEPELLESQIELQRKRQHTERKKADTLRTPCLTTSGSGSSHATTGSSGLGQVPSPSQLPVPYMPTSVSIPSSPHPAGSMCLSPTGPFSSLTPKITIFSVDIHKLAPDITLTEYTGPFFLSAELKKRVC